MFWLSVFVCVCVCNGGWCQHVKLCCMCVNMPLCRVRNDARISALCIRLCHRLYMKTFYLYLQSMLLYFDVCEDQFEPEAWNILIGPHFFINISPDNKDKTKSLMDKTNFERSSFCWMRQTKQILFTPLILHFRWTVPIANGVVTLYFPASFLEIFLSVLKSRKLPQCIQECLHTLVVITMEIMENVGFYSYSNLPLTFEFYRPNFELSLI